MRLQQKMMTIYSERTLKDIKICEIFSFLAQILIILLTYSVHKILILKEITANNKSTKSNQVRKAPMHRHDVLSSLCVEPRPHKTQTVCPGNGFELPSGHGEQSLRDLPLLKSL